MTDRSHRFASGGQVVTGLATHRLVVPVFIWRLGLDVALVPTP